MIELYSTVDNTESHNIANLLRKYDEDFCLRWLENKQHKEHISSLGYYGEGPHVIVDGEYIGGYIEVRQWLKAKTSKLPKTAM